MEWEDPDRYYRDLLDSDQPGRSKGKGRGRGKGRGQKAKGRGKSKSKGKGQEDSNSVNPAVEPAAHPEHSEPMAAATEGLDDLPAPSPAKKPRSEMPKSPKVKSTNARRKLLAEKSPGGVAKKAKHGKTDAEDCLE